MNENALSVYGHHNTSPQLQNPLNSAESLGSGRVSLAPLGPLRGLPPLKVPPLKSGALAPLQPPLGLVSWVVVTMVCT